MKKISFIISLILIVTSSCYRESSIDYFIKNKQYFTSAISWDTANMGTYGSGEIRFFGKNDSLKIFSNSFLRNHDSLTWGEPGIVLKQGTWKITKNIIVCNFITTFRTFKIRREEIMQIDTLKLVNDNLINNNLKLSSDVLLSKEIINFFQNDWSRIK